MMLQKPRLGRRKAWWEDVVEGVAEEEEAGVEEAAEEEEEEGGVADDDHLYYYEQIGLLLVYLAQWLWQDINAYRHHALYYKDVIRTQTSCIVLQKCYSSCGNSWEFQVCMNAKSWMEGRTKTKTGTQLQGMPCTFENSLGDLQNRH